MRRRESHLSQIPNGPLGILPPNTHWPSRLIGLALLVVAIVALGYSATTLFRPTANAVPMSVLETQIPTQPVATLDRIDLGARIANTGSARAENLAAEMTIVDPAGNVVTRMRQTGIALDGRETRAIRWGWRVPGQAPAGTYTARVVVTRSDGARLASSDARPSTFSVVADH
jgi:hypothetical protein